MALRTVKPYARLTARRGAGFYICWVSRGPVAQGIEQQPSKLKVAGSNPAGVANISRVRSGGPFRTHGYGRRSGPQRHFYCPAELVLNESKNSSLTPSTSPR